MFAQATSLGVSSLQKDTDEFLKWNLLDSEERLYVKFIPKVK